VSSQRNADIVRGIYDAFGRGDIPAILETLSEDVAWEQWEDNHAQRAAPATCCRAVGARGRRSSPRSTWWPIAPWPG
jgi:ketosteroid isomerase-like protein